MNGSTRVFERVLDLAVEASRGDVVEVEQRPVALGRRQAGVRADHAAAEVLEKGALIVRPEVRTAVRARRRRGSRAA